MSRWCHWIRRSVACLLPASLAAWVPDAGGVWRDGSVAVAFEFAANAPSPALDWAGAASEAMAAWNAHVQRVQLTAGVPSGRPGYDNGRNEVFFSDKVYGAAFPSGVLAITGITVDLGERVEADIVINTAETWAIYRGPLRAGSAGSADFRRVLIHELGHLLGLDHPDEANQQTPAIMNSTLGDIEAPTADDQTGARALYDRGAGGPPIIVGHPPRTTAVRQGMPAELRVAAGGRGPMRYVWRRNGVPVAGATSARFFVDAADLADAGTYSVVVSNAVGAATSADAALTVVAPGLPAWGLTSTAPVTLAAGEDFLLTGAFHGGLGPFRFRWLKNGSVIAETETGALKLEGVQMGDAGDYALVVTNAAGSVTTPAVRLTVTPGVAPRFLTGVTSAAYGAGARVTLSATVAGTPRASYQWQKNGAPIALATNATLTLPSFRLDDAGTYELVLTTPFGRVTSAPGVIAALEGTAPKITRQPSPVSEYAGNNVTFDFAVDGPGAASVRWLKDGELLVDIPGDTEIRGGALHLTRIAARHAGVYVVEILGASGIARTHPAPLWVLEPPRPLLSRHPAAHTVAVGGAVNLSVGVAGDTTLLLPPGAPLAYQWFKDGQPLAGQTREALAFAAQPGDAGSYFVRVSAGAQSTDSESAEVTVTTGAAPIISAHMGSIYMNSGNREDVRLSGVGLSVQLNRMASATRGVVRLNLVSRLPVPPGLSALLTNVPGVYTITVTRDGVAETTRPFTFGFLPATLAWIRRHPLGGVFKPGETINLEVNAVSFSPNTYRWTKDGVTIAGATDHRLTLTGFSEREVGSYQVTVTTDAGAVAAAPAVLELFSAGLPEIREHPLSQTGAAGSTVALRVVATGGTLRYQWQRDGQPVAGATSAELNLPGLSAANTGSYRVVVTNDVGARTSRAAEIGSLSSPRAPEILAQPLARNAVLGGEVSFIVGADGVPPPDRYQWRRNGVPVPGATEARLRLQGIRMEDAGDYTVVVGNALGSVTSQPAPLRVDTGGRLVNLATRARVGTGTNALIAGFVIGGAAPRAVLVRGIGDQLSEFGVTDVLRNPVLRIFDDKSRPVAASDDWDSGGLTNEAEVMRRRTLIEAARGAGAFPLRAESGDAAVIATLAPGSYTAQVTGFVETTGVALIEIYELGVPGENRLVNLSSRAVVGTGANLLIPGLVLTGQSSRRLLVRAVGPGLADFGVDGTLADPRLTVFRGTEIVAQNDNWGEQPDAARLAPAMAAVGAFPLRAGSRDAVLLVELPPGNYTVQVAGVGETTGIALVEVYELPAAGGAAP